MLSDEEKDLFIKNELKKDELISKKADNLINDYMNNKEKLEQSNTKVVELNQKINNKHSFRKNILSLVASFMIIFLTANGYAATKGYNNIFFIIKNAFTQKEDSIFGKDEILSDRDITISYNMIKVSNDVNIQVSRLIVSEEKASLTTTFAVDGNAKNYPSRILIYDLTKGEPNKTLADYNIATPKTEYANQFTEIIDLKGFSNNTNNLIMKVYSGNECIVELEIILDQKEINVISITEEKAEKISEVELKEFLSQISRINYYKDNNKLTGSAEEEKRNEIIVQIVSEKLGNNSNNNMFNKCLQELIGNDYGETTQLLDIKAKNNYKSDIESLCLAIEDISYSNGVYTIKYIYCYPEKGKSSEIELLDQFEATAKIKLNDSYDYSRYCLINSDDMQTTKIEKNEKLNIENNINNTSTTNTISNKITNNTTSNNKNSTVDNLSKANIVISIDKSVSPITGMYFYVDKVQFNGNNKAVLHTRISESKDVPKEKRISDINISYDDPSNEATTILYKITSEDENSSKEFTLPNITAGTNTMSISLKCENGFIADLKLNIKEKALTIEFGNEALDVIDIGQIGKEIKETASKYILMNYYKDTENNSSQEAKNEMMLYTAFLIDEEGMYRNLSTKPNYTRIGESIIYSIIKGYTGINFDSATKFTQNFMTREESQVGGESSIKYISGNKYNLDVNIIDVEKMEMTGSSEYSITFLYSYSLKSNNKYRATISLIPYEFDENNPIAKQFVLYKLTDADIKSEIVN